MRVYTKAQIEKATDGEFTAIASSEAVDRQGEVIEQTGWDLKNFKDNPIILWGHNHAELPIGKATRVWVDKTGPKPLLKIKGMISDATTKAREIKQLMADGILKTFSVGFRPIDQDGERYIKQELLEVSVVNVPANQEASLLAFKSLKKAGFDNDEIAELGIPAHMMEQMGKLQAEVKSMNVKIDTAVKGIQYLNPQGSKREALVAQQTVLKAIVKASDHLAGKPNLPKENRVHLAKTVKLATEKLLSDNRKQINGSN